MKHGMKMALALVALQILMANGANAFTFFCFDTGVAIGIDADGVVVPMGGCAGGPWGFNVNLGDRTTKSAQARQIARALNATTPETFRKTRRMTAKERRIVNESSMRLESILIGRGDVPKYMAIKEEGVN